MESSAVMRSSAVTFSTSFWVMVERTQVLAEDLAMALLVARCFMRIHSEVRSGAMRERRRDEESAMEAAEGTRLVNSGNPPPRPLYIFWMKDSGLKRGARSANGSPLTVENGGKLQHWLFNGPQR
jgi:hypothetical protein